MPLITCYAELNFHFFDVRSPFPRRDTYIDGHESKPAISILAIVQESRKTSAFGYFSSYSFYFIT